MLGCRQRQHKPWISDDTIKKIEERRETKHKVIQARTRAKKQRLRQEYSECDKEVKRSAKNDKRDFVEELATQAQKAAEKNDTKALYNITKQLGGRKTNSNRPVEGKDGHVLSKPAEQLDRWREHFSELLSGTPVTTPPLIEEGEDLEVNLDPSARKKSSEQSERQRVEKHQDQTTSHQKFSR